MKRILALPAALLALASPTLAGNVDAARIEPEVIEAVAASSSADGLIIMGIMITVVLLAALQSTSSSMYYPT